MKADRPATALDAQFQGKTDSHFSHSMATLTACMEPLTFGCSVVSIAMMFGAWPGQHGGGGDAPISTQACSPGNPSQEWLWDAATGGLQLVGGGCVDVKECDKDFNSVVDLFPGLSGWVCGIGSPKTKGTCNAVNEQWSVVKNSNPADPCVPLVSITIIFVTLPITLQPSPFIHITACTWGY